MSAILLYFKCSERTNSGNSVSVVVLVWAVVGVKCWYIQCIAVTLRKTIRVVSTWWQRQYRRPNRKLRCWRLRKGWRSLLLPAMTSPTCRQHTRVSSAALLVRFLLPTSYTYNPIPLHVALPIFPPRPFSTSVPLHTPPPPPIYLHIPPLFVEKFIPHLGAAVSEILTPRRGGKKSVVPSNMLSSRSDNPTEPPTIPGLELSPRDMSSRPGYYGDTSRRSMAGQKENFSPMKELGVQTDLTQRSSHPVEANDVSTNTDP